MGLLKRTIGFVAFQIIFCPLLAIYLVFYGPFTNIKETFVTSAMTTLRHQYLAKLFLSDEEINDILEKNRAGIVTEEQNEGEVIISRKDNNIELISFETSKFRGNLLIVDNPNRVSVGTTDGLGDKGMTLSQITKKYNAIAGINAGGFADKNFTGTGGHPTGIVIENGKIVYKDDVDKFSIVGFDENDVLIVGSYTLKQIKNKKIRDAVSFGPPLIVNGKPMIKKGDGGWGIAPRTAIGQRQDGAVLLLTIDGRQKDSIGATLKEVQDILLKYGAYNASNLDGGSSTTMYYQGKVVNKPSDILGERSIPTAFIVK
ncbi:MAG: phosphodiester glycosidase family protein [Clostridiales bacterium]|nr:phosphodiester glycosidase family protein [Clostridiales bacterium]